MVRTLHQLKFGGICLCQHTGRGGVKERDFDMLVVFKAKS